MNVRWSFALFLGSTAIPTCMQAQGATLAGVAVDSIRGGALRGASIFVSGTTMSATTDASGRFRFSRIPAGNRKLEVQHPFLDSLGLTLSTPPQVFADGDSSFVMLSIPSARTYAASVCPASQVANGPGVLAGTVFAADSGTPSAGASVNVSWVDYEITRKSIKSIPQRKSATVSQSGSFRICGLPADLTAAVVATSGTDSTASVDVDLRTGIATVSLRIPPRNGSAFISGLVVDSQRKPASGARVSVEGDEAAAVTGSDGVFAIRGLRPGTRRIAVRKIGFEPVERAVDIPVDGLTDQNISLGRSVSVLKSIVVKATRDLGLQRVGFTDRKLRRPGAFFTPKDIEIRNGPSVKDLLRTIPLMRRPGCTRYFVDGFLQPLGDPDEYLSGAEIGAVEVYGSQFSPPEFYAFTPSGGQCRSVVIWTKWKIDKR